MYQTTLFDDEPIEQHQIVNVASVPQRSPFRYPGGKTWLVPHIRRWLKRRGQPSSYFLEPFAGGAIVGLTTAFEQLAEHIIMVERDEEVAAVWNTIMGDDGEWLAHEILNFTLTPETVQRVLNQSELTPREMAFRTIVKNRVNHGGILAPGSGVVKHGENGRGMLSRWYPKTLKQRILDIISIRERITFIEGDGLEVMDSMQTVQMRFSLSIRPTLLQAKRLDDASTPTMSLIMKTSSVSQPRSKVNFL